MSVENKVWILQGNGPNVIEVLDELSMNMLAGAHLPTAKSSYKAKAVQTDWPANVGSSSKGTIAAEEFSCRNEIATHFWSETHAQICWTPATTRARVGPVTFEDARAMKS